MADESNNTSGVNAGWKNSQGDVSNTVITTGFVKLSNQEQSRRTISDDGYNSKKPIKYFLGAEDLDILEFCGGRIVGSSQPKLLSNIILICHKIFSDCLDRSRFELFYQDDYGIKTVIDIWSVDIDLEPTIPGQDKFFAPPNVHDALESLGSLLGVKSKRLVIRHCVRTLGVLLDLVERGRRIAVFDSRSKKNSLYELPLDSRGRPRVLSLVPGKNPKEVDDHELTSREVPER